MKFFLSFFFFLSRDLKNSEIFGEIEYWSFQSNDLLVCARTNKLGKSLSRY